MFSQSAVVCDAIPLNMEISREITITPIDYPRYNASALLFPPVNTTTLLLSRFKGHFSRWTWVIRYQNVSILDFVGSKEVEVVVIAGAIRHAKLQSNRNHQQTNTQPDAVPVTQQTVSKH